MRKQKWVYLVAAISALLAVLIWAFSPRPVQVELATASMGRFESSITEDGKTRLHDYYVISTPLAARIARIHLREGDTVQSGAVVATLYPVFSPLLDTRTLQEQLARVESTDAMVSRANTRIELAKVALEQTQVELRRSEKLAPDRFVSASKLEMDRLAERIAKKELATAIEEHHVATHELQQARAALVTVKQAPSSRENASFSIKTPVTGKVLRIIEPNENVVSIGTPILEIGDTEHMEIVAELLTADALQAKLGAPVRIERWGGQGVLLGRVRRVEPAAFTKVSALGVEEQRVNVVIDITSPAAQWKDLGSAYRVSVSIITLAKENVLRVPVSAVFPQSNSKDRNAMAVFIVEKGRAKRVPVQLGARNSVDAWITSGLKVGDQAIIYPGNTIKEGVRVSERLVNTPR